MHNKRGFTLIEILVVVFIIGVLAAIISTSLTRSRLKAQNANIVATISSLPAAIDLSKYPNSLADLCLDFEAGGEFEHVRLGIETQGGIWHCDSTVDDYRIYVKLHQNVVVAQNSLGLIPYVLAQGSESTIHNFGNYYCINSDFNKNFTHWSGDNLEYPSCNDADYIATPEDPVETPEPTPDPDPESDPEPPLEDGGSACEGNQVEICHFDKTICVSQNGWNNGHSKHGDTLGSCS